MWHEVTHVARTKPIKNCLLAIIHWLQRKSNSLNYKENIISLIRKYDIGLC